MAALAVFVIIIIILSILLFEKIKIGIVYDRALKLSVTGTLISVEFSNLFKRKQRKRKRKLSLPALGKSLSFLLGRSRIRVMALPSRFSVSPPVFGLYEAAVSLLLAYSETLADKLILPQGEGSMYDASLNVELDVRAWVIFYSFLIYKVKAAARRVLRVGQ